MAQQTPSLARWSRRRWLIATAFCAVAGHAPALHAAEHALPAGLNPPAKPAAMPAFTLPTTSGSKLDSQSLKGQVLVIRFWASW